MPRKKVSETIGERLRKLRGERPRSEIARKAGVHYDTVLKVEQGHRGVSLDVVEAIVNASGKQLRLEFE